MSIYEKQFSASELIAQDRKQKAHNDNIIFFRA